MNHLRASSFTALPSSGSLTNGTSVSSSDWSDLAPAEAVGSTRRLRKSCDRCHQQKLRCAGDKVSRTSCTRCQRLGVECVYSLRSNKQPRRDNIGPKTPQQSQASTSNNALTAETTDSDLLQFHCSLQGHQHPDFSPLFSSANDPLLLGDTAASCPSTTGLDSSPSIVWGGSLGSDYQLALEGVEGSGLDPFDRLAGSLQTLETAYQTVFWDASQLDAPDCEWC